MKKCDFTYKHYKDLIVLAKRKGYVFSNFFQKQDAKKRIYLRHDVDISLHYALKMAEIEKREGIKSTYLIMLDSPYYNIFDGKSREIIKKISKLGHDIGIHYSWQTESREKVAENLRKQYKLLDLLSFPIKRVVSFHRPAKNIIGESFSPFVNTYGPDFFPKVKYISDSNRNWREGCLCQFLEKYSFRNLQVLMHPIWWDEKKVSYIDIYKKLEKEKIEDMKLALASDILTYRKLFKKL